MATYFELYYDENAKKPNYMTVPAAVRELDKSEMARMTSVDTLEKIIGQAQAQDCKTKKQYDAAVAALSDLLDKRDALRRDELVKAIMKSGRTYEEVLEFLGTGAEEEEA